jgi:16S rRNA (guanine527-N7)-methyltransferase
MQASPGNERKLSWNDLPALFPGFRAPKTWLPRLQKHAHLVAEAAPRVRVSAVDPADAIRRHYAESLELLRIILAERDVTAVADVGSGGGFPGLVIACVLDDCPVHLVESLQKRAKLLADLAEALGLRHVTVHALRGEEAGRGELRDGLPIVTARAVAPLHELLEYTAPLAATGGSLFFPKGSGLSEELTTAKRAMEALNCEVRAQIPMRAEINPLVSVLRLDKRGPTPERYPRRPGMPAKHPLL